jgi:hypothetical protein
MDEMETFEKTKLKPLSIALAVTEGGRLVETQVAEMRCKGHLAEISFIKYGDREDTRKEACRKVLQQVANILIVPQKVFFTQFAATTIKFSRSTDFVAIERILKLMDKKFVE